MAPSSPTQADHPWPTGHLFQSPGAHLTYRVVGPCCRLFDREQLPWPCCRIQWRGKEPSWRRIGKRLVPDMATRKAPSYCVEIVGQGYHTQPFVTTLYTTPLDPATRRWWYTQAAHLNPGIDRVAPDSPDSSACLAHQSG
ncbi:MAG: hypothetical protein ACHWZW_10650 [Spirulina sp.]